MRYILKKIKKIRKAEKTKKIGRIGSSLIKIKIKYSLKNTGVDVRENEQLEIKK
jgi:hypothetical protein